MQGMYREIQKEYDDNRSAALRAVEKKKKEVEQVIEREEIWAKNLKSAIWICIMAIFMH